MTYSFPPCKGTHCFQHESVHTSIHLSILNLDFESNGETGLHLYLKCTGKWPSRRLAWQCAKCLQSILFTGSSKMACTQYFQFDQCETEFGLVNVPHDLWDSTVK
jgi:hypothetical protein